MIRRR